MGAGLSVGKGGHGLAEEDKKDKEDSTPGRMPEQGVESEGETRGHSLTGHGDLFELGTTRLKEFRRLGIMNDIEEAIGCLVHALEMTPDNHPSLSDRHANLGASYRQRYRRLGRLEDLEKSTEHLSRALTLTPNDHPSLSDRHTNLGVSYRDRYKRLGQLDDLDKSTKHRLRAIALISDDHPSLSLRHTNLGASYGDRYKRLGQLADLDKSTEHRLRALELTPDGHSSLSDRHVGLGVSYGDRYQRLGQLEDLDKSTEHLTRALKLTPDGHPSLSDWHANLGSSYSDRYKRLGQLNDLDKSTEHRLQALTLTPHGHSSLLDRHVGLGVAYSDRYRRLGQLEDLDKSTEHRLRTIELTPDDHPSLPDRHASLGVSYGDRYQRLGQLDDLDKSTEHLSHALMLTRNGHPSLSDRHANLGAAYGDRYRRLGRLEDLDKSAEHLSRALTLTPDSHPSLSDRHASLGMSYSDRYKHLGQLEDLNKSTEHRLQALTLTPDGHPSLSDRHVGLGVSYSDRYRRLGQLKDLDKSTEHRLRAIALTPNDHPSLPDRYASLGVAYSDRYRRLGRLDDLDKSTEHLSHALILTRNGHPSLSDRHSNLGVSYGDRYKRLGQLEDLEKSAEHTSRALALTPLDHPHLPDRHFHQAYTSWHQYQRTGDSACLTHTLASFRSAAQLLTGSPRNRFRNALSWTNLAIRNIFLNPLEAYQTTIDLLPQFIWLGATTHQRYQDLVTVGNLAISAACAAIVHSDCKLALEWLEHARCVVWNQILVLRSPIDELQSSHPHLAARFQTIAQKLHDAGSQSVAPEPQVPTSEPVDPEQSGKQRRRLAKEYEDLLAKARTLPGFEDFLQPIKVDRLVRAARNGPIVVINCHQDRCDALLISPGTANIQHLSLPSFTQNKAKGARFDLETSLRNKGIRERGFRVQQALGDNDCIARVLLTLWNDVVKPVLECLGYLDNVSVHSLPHITWCPTGALSFLPLHAAGDYSQPGSRAFDHVVSSYVPTLTALLQVASPPHSSEHPLRVLAVGQENTPGHSPLPGTTKELDCLANHTLDKADYAQLTGSQATTANVLDAMDKHDWVHLACHAHQNIEDPTKSGFYLQDGTLDLAALNRRSFKGKGLAFLSACQTATGDEKLPDEAIHLASGMLMAGYPSVIATMWSVMDDDAPLVADKVYAQLMRDGRVGNGEAGRALHNAVTVLREKVGEKEFARWVPYIHIGS